jgi:Acyl-CoA thioesterase C-terminal domain/Acyl-CoA thioesterase N-terminal domain
MCAVAVFVPEDGRFVATELARGPWDPGAQHGGAPAALLVRAFERLGSSDGLSLGRLTYEFLRPVPIGELSVEAVVTRPGRRVQLLEGSIMTSDGVEVVRARALRVLAAQVRAAPASVDPCAAPPPGPEAGHKNDFKPPFRPMFTPDAIEIRFVEGEFHDGGPATAWFRMRVPLVAGETASPIQRLAAAADFGNGISSALAFDEYLFINPDLTVYVERQPVGEWIALAAATRIAEDGIGLSESVLYDERGRIGRATQALLVARR